jgi:tetratricopeptide (TPR) repeat protein
VRVQAGRLRDLLDQYYAGEGAGQPLRISIPRGSYVPVYTQSEALASVMPVATTDQATSSVATQTVPPIASGQGTDRSRQWSLNRFVAVAAVVVATLATTVTYLHFARTDHNVAHADAPLAEVDAGAVTGSSVKDLLPTLHIDVAARAGEGTRLVAMLRRGLSNFDMISFLARPPEAGAQSLRTEFVIRVDDSANGAVLLELENVASGKVLLSRTMDPQSLSERELEDQIADFLTTIIPVSGVIYTSLMETGSETGLTRCLALNEQFYHDQKEDAHKAAYQCLKSFADSDLKSSLVYSELAGLHVQALANRYAYLEGKSDAQALAYARMAVHLAPGSPYAHRSMGYVLSRSSSIEESLRWTRKAYELNTFDLGTAASLGYRLIFAAEYVEGTPILQRAVTAASAHPTWWDYGLGLGYLMLDDPQALAAAVGPLAASKRAHYRALRLVAASSMGDDRQAASLLELIKTGNSNFVADPRSFFVRGEYPASLTERFLDALNRAGLSEPS